MNSATLVAAVYVTLPGTAAPPLVWFRVNVAVLMVAGSIGSLKVTVTFANVETVVEPFAGEFALTTGAVRSGVVTVAAALSDDGADCSPDAPFADTAYLYVVCSLNPVSVNDADVDSPTFVPFRKTL